jgi:hypothetical protein
MASQRFRILTDRITELRLHLLPDPFDPTGSYPNEGEIRTKTLAFRLLCHAELESYLEDRAIGIAKATWTAWEKKRFVSATTVHLLGFCGAEMPLPPETLQSRHKNQEKSRKEMVRFSEDRMKIEPSGDGFYL